MKKIFFLVIFIQIVKFSFSQIIFEKGYIVDTNKVKKECLIKNIDWKNTPSKFEYKLTENDHELTGDVNSIAEFGVYGYSHYISTNVLIDNSPIEITELNDKKNPVWTKKQLYLKPIVTGKACLYVYTFGDHDFYFYSSNNSDIQQLIFKEYKINDQIAKNEGYKQQLFSNVNNGNTTLNDVEYLKYNENDLTNYFNKINGTKQQNTKVLSKREVINIKPWLGTDNYDLIFKNEISGFRDVYFNRQFNLSGGLELEAFLPFNKNTWSFVFTPGYHQFIASNEVINRYGNATISIKTFNFPIGFRYHYYMSNEAKFFINAFYNSNFCLNHNSGITFDYTDLSLSIKPASSFIIGLGYNYKNTGIELKYNTSRNLLSEYLNWQSKSSYLTVSISYNLIKFYSH